MLVEKPMIYFPDELQFRDAGMRGASRIFRLTAPFSYISSRGVVTVPAGFDTDGASVPRVFWSVLDPFGPYFKAAVIHDCSTHRTTGASPAPSRMTSSRRRCLTTGSTGCAGN